MNEALNALLQHPAIWRGDRCARVALESTPSGFAELDALLPGGGWPMGALTEIFCATPGIGELRLALPALARLSAAGRWLAWIAPPHLPYAPTLAARGIELRRLLVVRARAEDALWAAEQALRSGACGAVLAWRAAGEARALRRLQLAAEAGRAWGLLFPAARAAASPSPATLRLHLEPAGDRLTVHILKRRGGGAVAPLSLHIAA